MAENSNSRTGSGWPCKRLPGRSRKGKGGGDTTCGGTSQPHQAGKGGARSSPKGVVGQSDCPGGSRRVEAAPIQSRTLRSARREVQRTEGVASLQESVTERRRANSPVALGEQLNGMVNQTGQGDPIQGANNEGCTFLREENTVYMFIPSARGTYTCTECPTACTKFRELATHYTTQHPDLDLKAKCSGCGFTGKFHSVSCHRPKCKGPERHQNGPTLDHRCDKCEKSFATKSGLSQHERHAHPVARNSKRIAGSIRGSSRTLWPPEDVRLLVELVLKYEREANINALIESELNGYTKQQIHDKRRLASFKRALEERRLTQGAVPELRQDNNPALTAHETHLAPEGANNGQLGDTVEAPTLSGDLPVSQDEAPAGGDGGPCNFVASEDLLTENPTCLQLELMQVLLEARENGGRLDNETTEWEKVEDIINRLLADWAKGSTKSAPAPPRNPQTRLLRKPCSRKTKEKKATYRQCQILWSKNRKRLAAEILDGKSKTDCPLSIQAVDDFWRPKLATVNDKCDLSGWDKPKNLTENDILLKLISGKEVLAALKSQKKGSAAGPDKVGTEALLRDVDTPHTLALIFNICMVTGKIPAALKPNRTILIPKGGVTTEPGNWRPITIGSMVLRLLTKIMAKRLLEAVPICERQRGFISAPDCSENLTLLSKCINAAKKKGHCSVAFLDLAKAFDTVGHRHLQLSLTRMGVCKEWKRLVADLYEGCTTRVHIDKERCTQAIPILRGVKQGDPLSPILFNIAMDPLLTTLDNSGKGYKYGPGPEQDIAALAFADDLAALASSGENLQWMCDQVERYCGDTGMKINVKKSAGFSITAKHKTFVVNEGIQWRIGGEDLPLVSPADVTKYLGAAVSPWVGLGQRDRETLAGQLSDHVTKIGKAPLKPLQKVELLTVYAIPRLVYKLKVSTPTKTTLEALDTIARSAVKSWLHLPACTADGFLYCSRKDSGLAVTRLSRSIPEICIRERIAVCKSKDRKICDMAARMGVFKDACNIAEKFGLPLPRLSAKGYDSKWRQAEFKTLCAKSVQGCGMKAFRDSKPANEWITRPGFISAGDHIKGLLLRANLFPCKEALTRGRAEADKSCRRCECPVESLSHVLGQCPALHNPRVARHHHVCKRLEEAAKKRGWTVMREQSFTDADGRRLRPDLVIYRQQRALIVDVTCRWESNSGGWLNAHAEKEQAYKGINEEVRRMTGSETVTNHGFVVGNRGAWTTKNDSVLEILGVNKALAKSLCNYVWRKSVSMLKVFTGDRWALRVEDHPDAGAG